MAEAMTDIRIEQEDINPVAIAIAVTGDRLDGTVLENKQWFDKYPDMIVSHFNDLCDYVEEQSPTGDSGLTYTATEITYITGALDCTEADITL